MDGDMTGRPAVSVVIPTHNRRDLLLRTLRSVLQQRDVAVSVIVVDDAGADGSTEAVRALGHPDVQAIRHPSCQGVSRARNTGLHQVDTPWVAFIDDDDLWAPDKLSAQLGALSTRPSARWSCAGAVLIDGDCRVFRALPPPAVPEISHLMRSYPTVPGGGSGVLTATSLAREVGGFDDQLSILADWDFYLRLSLNSPVAAVPRPLVGYYAHSDSMYHDINGVVTELLALEAKHAAALPEEQMTLDLASWSMKVAMMAYRDRKHPRPVLRLIGAELGRHGPLPLVREAALKGRRRVRRERDAMPVGWYEEATAWLAPYTAAAPEPADRSGYTPDA